MTLPLTYADLVCGIDLDPFANETTSDLQNLVQDIQHLLTELPGSNPDDPLRGIGLDNYLSGTVDNLTALPGIIEKQVGEDERVSTVAASLEQTSDGTYAILIELNVSGTVVPLHFSWGPDAGLAQVL